MADIPKMTIGVITQLTEDGFRQDIDIFGKKTQEFFDVKAMAADDAIRAKLIEIGWTPPGESNCECTECAASNRPSGKVGGIDKGNMPYWRNFVETSRHSPLCASRFNHTCNCGASDAPR